MNGMKGQDPSCGAHLPACLGHHGRHPLNRHGAAIGPPCFTLGRRMDVFRGIYRLTRGSLACQFQPPSFALPRRLFTLSNLILSTVTYTSTLSRDARQTRRSSAGADELLRGHSLVPGHGFLAILPRRCGSIQNILYPLPSSRCCPNNRRGEKPQLVDTRYRRQHAQPWCGSGLFVMYVPR